MRDRTDSDSRHYSEMQYHCYTAQTQYAAVPVPLNP